MELSLGSYTTSTTRQAYERKPIPGFSSIEKNATGKYKHVCIRSLFFEKKKYLEVRNNETVSFHR